MNDNSGHHWSFDYNYGAQNPQFIQELTETLHGCCTDADARDTRTGQTITHVYNILPNYWYGTGLLPSYWWLDASGNIAIASTFFETLVLKEKIGRKS